MSKLSTRMASAGCSLALAAVGFVPLLVGEFIKIQFLDGSWVDLLLAAAVSYSVIVIAVTSIVCFLPLAANYYAFFRDFHWRWLDYARAHDLISSIEIETGRNLSWDKFFPVSPLLKRRIFVITPKAETRNSADILPARQVSAHAGSPFVGFVSLHFHPGEATGINKYQFLHELGHFLPDIRNTFSANCALALFAAYAAITAIRANGNIYSLGFAISAALIVAALLVLNHSRKASIRLRDEIVADHFALTNMNVSWFGDFSSAQLSETLCQGGDGKHLRIRKRIFVRTLNAIRKNPGADIRFRPTPGVLTFKYDYIYGIISILLVASVCCSNKFTGEGYVVYIALAISLFIGSRLSYRLKFALDATVNALSGGENDPKREECARIKNRSLCLSLENGRRTTKLGRHLYVWRSLFLENYFRAKEKTSKQSGGASAEASSASFDYDTLEATIRLAGQGNSSHSHAEFDSDALTLKLVQSSGDQQLLIRVTPRIAAHLAVATHIAVDYTKNAGTIIRSKVPITIKDSLDKR